MPDGRASRATFCSAGLNPVSVPSNRQSPLTPTEACMCTQRQLSTGQVPAPRAQDDSPPRSPRGRHPRHSDSTGGQGPTRGHAAGARSETTEDAPQEGRKGAAEHRTTGPRTNVPGSHQTSNREGESSRPLPEAGSGTTLGNKSSAVSQSENLTRFTRRGQLQKRLCLWQPTVPSRASRRNRRGTQLRV